MFWVTDTGYLRYPLHMEQIGCEDAVRVTKLSGANQVLEIIRGPSPNRTGSVLLYRCPMCRKPRRYLYRLVVSGGKLADYFGLRCQACAGLRWASQGRYRNRLERAFAGIVAAVYLQHVRLPLPRLPWDPRAVSDPASILDEFPDELIDGSSQARQPRPASHHTSGRR